MLPPVKMYTPLTEVGDIFCLVIELLISHSSKDFDWSGISPTIFGAVFESTLNPETRRKGGMHYTSLENIHKVIDPLFLTSLKQEFEEVRAGKQPNVRKKKLGEFQDKLASLTFLEIKTQNLIQSIAA